VRLERSWVARGVAEEFGRDVGDILLQFHWMPTQDLDDLDPHHPSASLDFWAGSQRTLWLVGSLFLADSTLPRTGTISRVLWVGDDSLQQITLRLEDNIGFGIVDPYTAWRYRRSFRRMASALDAAIRERSAAVSDGSDAPPPSSDAPPPLRSDSP
jgi:hypothetical protein